VVNELLAGTMWPNREPMGQPIVIDSVTWTVVGVAANVHHGGLDEPVQFELYRPIDQAVQRAGDLAVQTAGDPATMRDVVRRAVAKTDPSAAVGEMMTMRELEARHVAVFRMSAGMLMVLAAVTMVIATVGLYGLIAYGVAQRTREIGLRIALGARPIDVLMRIGAGAAQLAIVGVAFGIAGAAAFARLLNAMLYGVTASDPATFVGAAVGLLTVSLVAALVPAWRASRLDPTIALRE
jgi:putative ABC transport system permease protein